MRRLPILPSEERRPLLEIEGLSKTFPAARGGGRIRVLQDVDLTIYPGEVVALVGESGSGKSTIGRIIARLETPEAGALRFRGENVLETQRRRPSLEYRAAVQMIFQDPFASLNPVHTVGEHLSRPLLRHERARKSEVDARVAALLRAVGLEPAEDFVRKYPYALSGGQRQRVAVARALAVEPQLIIADEPTSMLDVSVRMGVLNLLARQKRERGLAYLFITHDLASARYLADRIVVLYAGRVMEEGPTEALLAAPEHPYTRLLLARGEEGPRTETTRAPPTPERSRRDHGAVTMLQTSGCPFQARCPAAEPGCRERAPAPAETPAGGHVSCHLFSRPGLAPSGANLTHRPAEEKR